MRRQSLRETNPYLKDPDKYQKGLITNVSSSTAVETGASVEAIAQTLTESEETDRIKKRQRFAR